MSKKTLFKTFNKLEGFKKFDLILQISKFEKEYNLLKKFLTALSKRRQFMNGIGVAILDDYLVLSFNDIINLGEFVFYYLNNKEDVIRINALLKEALKDTRIRILVFGSKDSNHIVIGTFHKIKEKFEKITNLNFYEIYENYQNYDNYNML